MRRTSLILILLLLAGGQAEAADAPSHEEAAARVVKAVADKDEAALKAIVKADNPDCWEIVDTLLAQGEGEAATALGNAYDERLAAYAKEHAGSETYTVGRELLTKANAAAKAQKHQEVLKLFASVPEGAPPTLHVRAHRARAMIYLRSHEYDAAAAACEAGATIAERMGWNDAAFRLWRNCGLLHARMGRPAEAERAYRRELKIRESWGSDVERAAVLANLANLKWRTGDLKGAQAEFERALKVFEAAGNDSYVSKVLNNVASILLDLGEPERGKQAYIRSLEIARRIKSADDIGWPAYGLGNMYTTGEDPLAAEPYYAEALAAFRAIKDLRGEAITLRGMARNARSLGDPVASQRYAEQSLELHQKMRDAPGLARSFAALAMAHREQGHTKKAMALIEEARKHGAAAPDYELQWFLDHNAALVYVSGGRFAQAFQATDRLLDRATRSGNKGAIAEAHHLIAQVCATTGDGVRAIEHFRTAVGIWSEMGDQHALDRTRSNFALTLTHGGEFEEAAEQYALALERALALGAEMHAANIRYGLAVMHIKAREYPKALGPAQAALPVLRKAGVAESIAGLEAIIAEVLLRRGDTADGVAAAKRAVEAATETGSYDRLVTSLSILLAAHLKLEEFEEAGRIAQEATRALEGAMNGLDAESGAYARDKYLAPYEWGLHAALATQNAALGFYLVEHATAGGLRQALDAQNTLTEDLIPEALRAAEVDARIAEARAFEAYRTAARQGKRKDRRAARQVLEEARKARRSTIERIQREASLAAGLMYPRPAELAAVQAQLKADEAIVAYKLHYDLAVAIVVTADEARLVPIGKGHEIDALAEAALLPAHPHIDETKVAALAPVVVAPLKLPAAIKRVFIAPSSSLSYIPMAMLFTDHEIVGIPSATVWHALRGTEAAAGTGVLALGDPIYGEARARGPTRGGTAVRLAPLPGTRAEVEAIGTVKLLGKDATEAGFRAALPKQARWRSIHLACHGLVDAERPTYSSLALTQAGDDDGFLSCLDLFRMKVSADLVVLSACESSRGKIYRQEGVVGLPSAFMHAGARSVLASLWKVDDEATKALMIKFYEFWNPKSGEGIPPATALKRAQAHVRAQEKWKHPYYWAAWVLWGTGE